MPRIRVCRLILVSALCAIACGSKTHAGSHIREGSDLELTGCSFLQKVSGTASVDDKNAAAHAKAKAREEAAKLGATHIKWIIPCCTSVEGDAYRCDLPDE